MALLTRRAAAAAGFLLAASALWSQTRPPEKVFDHDVRRLATAAAAKQAVEKQAALTERLAGIVDSAGRQVRASFSPAGELKSLRSIEAALSRPSDADPEAVAREYLISHAALFSLSPPDVDSLELAATTEAAGLALLTFQQRLDGLPVWNGFFRAAVDREGRVRQVERGELVAGGSVDPTAVVSAAEAVRLGFESLGEEGSGEPLELAASPAGRRRFARESDPDGEPALVEPVVFPFSPALGVLAWRVFLETDAGAFEILIAAANGAVLLREGLTAEAGTARVWTENPLAGEREVVDFGEGWIPDDGTVTRGDFVDAFLDEDGDDEADPRSDEGFEDGRAQSDSQEFDFEAGDGFGLPFQAQPAAVTNAFYFANIAHDFFYALGFRERDGNFETDNGRDGGAGGDPMRLAVQSGAAINSASILTRPEGEPARIRLGVFFDDEGFRDSAFDGDVVIHEYTHGVTSRLVGGPQQIGCLNAGPQPVALGEAWSDYFSISYFDDPVEGEYTANDPVRGIRRAPYDDNPRTYADLGLTTPNRPQFEVHDDGEIFAATLWEIREALGAEAADQIILDAVKLAPCDPTFVDARDAILLAAGLEHRETLWAIFAARGIGHSASSQNLDQAVDVIFNAAFDLPPDLAADANRPPLIVSHPGDHALFGALFSYQIRALDLDGDELKYELVDAPEGTLLERFTGLLRWPSANFTGARFQVRVTDGRGGEVLHGFFLASEALLQLGDTVVLSGPVGSNGFAFFDVPSGLEALQIRLRDAGQPGDEEPGAAVLSLFNPARRLANGTLTDELTGTMTIDKPAAGEWILVVSAFTGYEGAQLTLDPSPPAELALDEPVRDLAGDYTSETFFRIDVPEDAERLRVVTVGGVGDLDLWLTRGAIPTCQLPISPICTAEFASLRAANVETIEVEDPEPGPWFVTVFGFDAYEGAVLRASIGASAIEPTSAVDAAIGRAQLAPLGLATLFGTELASETVVAEAGGRLPFSLGGVQVLVNGRRAALLMTSPEQINFQTPREALLDIPLFGVGEAVIEVATADDLSSALRVPLTINAPVIFEVALEDETVAAITHADGSLVTSANPAAPGERLTAYLTGLGFVRNAPPTGAPTQAAPLAVSVFPVEATVGDADAEVGFAGLTPGFYGLAQIDFVVPAEAAGVAQLVFTIDEEASPPADVIVAP